MEEIIVLKRCVVCGGPKLYRGPAVLGDTVTCDNICAALYMAMSDLEWIDATELLRGGRLYNRPEVWINPI